MPRTKEIRETDLVVPIPVIDIGNLLNLTSTEFDLKDAEIIKISKNIGQALHEHGFAYLSNHGVSEKLVADAFAESEQFFKLPLETKMKYVKSPGDASLNFHGYACAGQESLDVEGEDVKEWKEVFDFFTMGERSYPTQDDAPNFCSTLQKLEMKCRKLETRLMRLLAIAVGLEDKDYFFDRCQNLVYPEKYTSGSLFRTLLYPPIPEELKSSGTWIGCNEHCDWGVLTLLFQDDVGGLEVKTATGDWVKATPIPNTIVINTGRLLQAWTAGYLPATAHRVHVKPIKQSEIDQGGSQRARQSMAFFTQPDDIVTVDTLQTEVLPKVEDLTSVNAGDFFKHVSRRAYGQEG